MHSLQTNKYYFPVPGGIENHLCDLSEALAARGPHITVRGPIRLPIGA